MNLKTGIKEHYDRVVAELEKERVDCGNCGHRFAADDPRLTEGSDCPDCTFNPHRRGDLSEPFKPDIQLRSLDAIAEEAIKREINAVAGRLQLSDWSGPE